MSVVAYVESKWWGHHAAITQLAVRALLESGHRVLCVCPRPAEVSEYLEVHAVPNRQNNVWFASFRFEDVGRVPSRLSLHPLLDYRLRLWVAAKSAVQRAAAQASREPDIVVFGLLDDYLHPKVPAGAIDDLFPYPWTGFIMFARWLHGACGAPPPPVLARNCRELLFEDETLLDVGRAITGKPCFAFPATANVDTSNDALSSDWVTEMISFKGRNRLIGLVGCTDRRKGIFELLELARVAVGYPLRFLIYGSAVNRIGRKELRCLRRQIEKHDPKNVLWRQGHIPSENVFNAIISHLDMLWLGYKQFPFSSGQIAKAAFFRKPVLANIGGVIAARVSRYGLGPVAPVFDPLRTLDTVQGFFNRPDDAQSPMYEEYYNLHSVEAFGRVMREIAEPASRSSDVV